MTLPKFKIQDNLYNFPYHYVPHFDERGIPRISRILSWGWDYLTYTSYIKQYIENEIDVQTILDIGCGDGYILNSLHGNYVLKKGIDISEKSIRFAKAFSSDAHFEVIDITNENGKFDLVMIVEVLEHILDEFIKDFIKNTINKINENGYLLVCVPTKTTPEVPINPKHYRHYDEELLDKHVNNPNIEIIKEIRLYNRDSWLLKNAIKFLYNNFFSINSKFIIKHLWKWHCHNTYFASNKTGKHLLRVYKKVKST